MIVRGVLDMQVWRKPVGAPCLPEFRTIGTYFFEDGSLLRIMVSGDVDTLEAVGMAEELLRMKRAELMANQENKP
jgi:hypothetical protein